MEFPGINKIGTLSGLKRQLCDRIVRELSSLKSEEGYKTVIILYLTVVLEGFCPLLSQVSSTVNTTHDLYRITLFCVSVFSSGRPDILD